MSSVSRELARWVPVLAMLVVIGASCEASGPNVRPSALGPFVDSDPSGVIVDAHWVDPTGQTSALSRPIPFDEPGAVLMETSEPSILRIAVNGGGCVPETSLSVLRDPPALELLITLSEAIPEPGLQCTAVLGTHAFEVQLSEPVIINDVELSVAHSTSR